MSDATYSLRLVIEFLKNNKIPYTYCSANVDYMFYEHGCRIKLDDTYTLSIQTHPMIAGKSFAETALRNMVTGKIVEDGTHDYDDIKRFWNPSDLFDHILSLNPMKSEGDDE